MNRTIVIGQMAIAAFLLSMVVGISSIDTFTHESAAVSDPASLLIGVCITAEFAGLALACSLMHDASKARLAANRPANCLRPESYTHWGMPSNCL